MTETQTRTTNFFATLPGIAVSLAVAIIAQAAAQLVPALGGATLAILLGIALGNTLLRQPQLARGTKFAESKFLEVSVMLLGLTLTVSTLSAIGIRGFLFVALQMCGTIAFVLWLGRRLNFADQERQLMAGGNAICGSSAIASIAPVIEADERQVGTIVTIVNLMGTVLMLTLPLIAPLLVGHSALAIGALIGGTVQSVGQVIASASMVGDQTVVYATLFKIMRIILLVFAVLFFSHQHQRQARLQAQAQSQAQSQPQSKPQPTPAAARPKQFLIPWYVLGFAVFCLLGSVIELPKFVAADAHWLSGWLETTALAAIGLRLDLRAFLKEGKHIALFGGGTLLMQVALGALLVRLLVR